MRNFKTWLNKPMSCTLRLQFAFGAIARDIKYPPYVYGVIACDIKYLPLCTISRHQEENTQHRNDTVNYQLDYNWSTVFTRRSSEINSYLCRGQIALTYVCFEHFEILCEQYNIILLVYPKTYLTDSNSAAFFLRQQGYMPKGLGLIPVNRVIHTSSYGRGSFSPKTNKLNLP